MAARHGQHLHGFPDGDHLIPGDMELLDRDAEAGLVTTQDLTMGWSHHDNAIIILSPQAKPWQLLLIFIRT